MVKAVRTGYIIMSVIFCISGLACMFISEIPCFQLCIFSGIILAVYGVIKILGYISKDLYCFAFQYDLACGLFIIVLGIIVIAYNYKIRKYMAAGMGGLILLDSLLTVQMSLEAKEFGIKTWGVMLALAVAAGTMGVLIIINPFGKIEYLHLLEGLGLWLESAMKYCVVKFTVKI